jgi:hypothetical protein
VRVLLTLVMLSGVDDHSLYDRFGVGQLNWNSHGRAGVGGIYILLDLEADKCTKQTPWSHDGMDALG